jgi:hypothetical protein
MFKSTSSKILQKVHLPVKLTSSGSEGTASSWKQRFIAVSSVFNSRASDTGMWILGVLSTDFSKNVTDWLETAVDTTPTIYDKFVDALYNSTSIGGPIHRLFDGSHSPLAMWEKVQEARSDDTFIQEIVAYFSTMSKDLITDKGIPLTTISPETYDRIATLLNEDLGIPRSWASDILSVNATELFATSFGVFALALNWNTENKKRFAEIATSVGLAAAYSANPILGLIGIASLAKSFNDGRNSKSYSDFARGIFTGGVGTGTLLITSSVIGGPAWIGLVVGMCLAMFARKHAEDFNPVKVAEWIKAMGPTRSFDTAAIKLCCPTALRTS